MYGPMPSAPVPRPSGPSAGVIAVRVLLTILVVLSLGLLAWVAMLRIAIMRRTARDWALFWVQLVLNIACVVPLEQRFAGTWMNTAGMIALLVQMALVAFYYVVVDIRHHQPAPVVVMAPPRPYHPQGPAYAPPNPYLSAPAAPVAPPVPPASPRIDQVRAELDELSDLLRKDGDR